MRTRIAVQPQDAVAVRSLAATAACLATWAGGLLFGVDGVAGLLLRHAGDASPAPRPPRSPGQSQLRSRTVVRPVLLVKLRRFQKAAALPRSDVTYGRSCQPGISLSIRPCRLKRGDMAHPCRRVHLPPVRSATLGIADRVAPRRRQPQANGWRPCRTSTGRLSQSVGVSSQQRGHRATNGRRQNTPGTTAPRKRRFSGFPPLAAMPIWRPVTTGSSAP